MLSNDIILKASVRGNYIMVRRSLTRQQLLRFTAKDQKASLRNSQWNDTYLIQESDVLVLQQDIEQNMLLLFNPLTGKLTGHTSTTVIDNSRITVKRNSRSNNEFFCDKGYLVSHLIACDPVTERTAALKKKEGVMLKCTTLNGIPRES